MRSRVTPLTTSVVPRTEFHRPGRSAPAPSCAAQPSVMPAITGVPVGIPVAAAATRLTAPMTVPDRTSSGSRSAGTSSASMTSSGHRSSMRCAPVFSALLRSAGTSCPTRRRLTKSDWCASLAPRGICGDASSSQRSFGRAHDGCIRQYPSSAQTLSPAALIRSTYSAARVSSYMSPGVRGDPSRSTRAIVPDVASTATPRTDPVGTVCIASDDAAAIARHHASGSCSCRAPDLWPVSGCVPAPTTSPLAVTATARAL